MNRPSDNKCVNCGAILPRNSDICEYCGSDYSSGISVSQDDLNVTLTIGDEQIRFYIADVDVRIDCDVVTDMYGHRQPRAVQKRKVTLIEY